MLRDLECRLEHAHIVHKMSLKLGYFFPPSSVVILMQSMNLNVTVYVFAAATVQKPFHYGQS